MSFELEAKTRVTQGSGASRRLRRANRVPGILYGGNEAPNRIELEHNPIFLALKKEAFHSSIIKLTLDGKTQMVLLRDAQMHPYKPLVLHVDFLRVDETHAIHQKVPLHFINGDMSLGVKRDGGIVSHTINEIEVTCLPQDLPTFIEVDLKDLQVGHSCHASQLTMPPGVKVVLHAGEDPVVATIVPARKEAAETEAAASTSTPDA